MRAVLLLTATAAAVTACASPSGGSPAGDAGTSSGPASGAAPASGLVVVVDQGDGSPVDRFTLSCGEVVEGDHPDGVAACEHLAGLDDPFAPLPDDAVCTEQYGGPQTAEVTGTWRGEPVDLDLSRVDGCAISQWDSLGPLLPGSDGVAPPS